MFDHAVFDARTFDAGRRGLLRLLVELVMGWLRRLLAR
jgi:hypothetical protein